MIKVSIIVAAYNVEDYIEKCLKSIMNQTLKDIELIVVNDGSKDNTLSKINSLASSDKRIKVITTLNQGVSKARNTGLRSSMGEYVLFVDADDWLDKKALELLYNNGKKENSDLVCYDYIFEYESGKNVTHEEINFKAITGQEYLDLCLKSKVALSLWSKLIRRQLLTENEIICPENIAFGEDMATSIHIACFCNKVSKVNKALYYYLQRSTSVTKTSSNKLLNIMESINEIKKYLIETNRYDNFKRQFVVLKFQHLYYYNVVKSNIFGESHKHLYDIWQKDNDKNDLCDNEYFTEFLSKESRNDKFKLKLYDFSYNIGKSYVTTYGKIKRVITK